MSAATTKSTKTAGPIIRVSVRPVPGVTREEARGKVREAMRALRGGRG